MANLIKMTIQFRRDLAANWELHKDVIPAQGEPCFVTDKNILKIGDGVTTFEHLEPINGVKIDADGKSLVLEDNVLKLMGFDAAEVGAQPRKGKDGNIEWVVPSTETVEGLQTTVAGLQTDVSGLQGDVSDLKAIVGTADEGSEPLLSRVESLEKEMNTIVSGLTDDGKVNTMKELIAYVESHGEEAANMASEIKSLQELVGTTAVQDQILVVIEESEKKAKATFEHVKYEVSHKPVGTLVDYRDKEIRVMVPADTKFEHQNSGANADANAYYIGFKAYAPDGAVSFKEDLAEIISDNTMYTFEGNDFAGIDAYGRKYSICWLAVAKYDEATQTWSRYGAQSTKEKYLGWYYSVEWYNANGVKIDSDCIRINLSNEDCHSNIEPFYMANIVKEITVNGTLLDIVDGKANITVNNIIKTSDEIVVNEDGTLGIGTISFSKIAQEETETIIMDGGSAV